MPTEKEQALHEEIEKYRLESESVPKEINSESVSTDVKEEPEHIKHARALGWKSKEEREAEGKDNIHFVEAEEYVRRQPLFERIEKQNKELRDVKERQRQFDSHLSQVRKEAYEQALRDLETKREIAVSEANTDEFRRLDLQAKQMHQQMQQDPMINHAPMAPIKNPEIESFETRNSWYSSPKTNEDMKMKAAAEAVDNFLAQSAKVDGRDLNVRDHLASVESEVKRLFPHRFEAPKINAPSVAMVGKSTTGASSFSSSKDLVSRLTAQQREMGERFYKTNKEFTLEEYAKQLEFSGRLGK